MDLDPRTPVIVGVAQINQRTGGPAEALEPVALLAEALAGAAADSGSDRLLGALESLTVVRILSWRYSDPAALVADRLGITLRRTVHTTVGGNSPQMAINEAARAIARGDLEVAAVGGAETWRSRTAIRSTGAKPDWTPLDDRSPTLVLGKDEPMSHPAEQAVGLFLPIHVYPLFESALGAAAGDDPVARRAWIARWWAGFSEVAAANPHAWTGRRYLPGEIATPGPDNRMISVPYTKLMCSNNNVEQAAAVILCSAGRARALGIPRDRWVFCWAGTEADDRVLVSERPDMAGSPAIRVAGNRCLELAGVGPDDLTFVDLYSCFPSAVQVAARELGMDPTARVLTVTGGLAFAGGPWNNYVTHSVATMVDRLRDQSEPAVGLCTANGGFLSKHAFGVYGNHPSGLPEPFVWERPQAEVDAAGSVEVTSDYAGPATVEAHTVAYDRSGPERAFLALRTPDGRRRWAHTHEPDALAGMSGAWWVGRTVGVDGDGRLVDVAG